MNRNELAKLVSVYIRYVRKTEKSLYSCKIDRTRSLKRARYGNVPYRDTVKTIK